MHAFLFINPQAKDIQNKAEELDAKLIEFVLQKIDEVRDINNFTKLKLIEKTAILLNNFDKATDEAQNSFLKSLEEPQENLFFILTATNRNEVLETIISRCEVIEVSSISYNVSSEDKEETMNFMNSHTGQKLLYISKINKRDDAIKFITKIIVTGHNDLVLNYKNTEVALKTLKNLEANGNVQLQLTNFVVNSRI